MPVNFPPTLSMNCIFSGQKSLNDFSPHFGHFFTARPISESYNNPLKVIPEGSMVEYLSVGSQEAPQTIISKKKFQTYTIMQIFNLRHHFQRDCVNFPSFSEEI